MMLARLGARWALFETQDFEGLEEFNLPAGQHLILPHPVVSVGQTLLSARKHNRRPRVGVAGYYRPEKGMDELVQLLKEACPDCDILLGVPNPEAAGHLEVETVCTASEGQYFEMVSRCDVLVFNGDKHSYFYRASGPVADAAACGTAVVAPDFPMIGKQVAGIGEVFQVLEQLPNAVGTAVEKVRAGQYDFERYCAGRSVEVLAEVLEQFTNG